MRPATRVPLIAHSEFRLDTPGFFSDSFLFGTEFPRFGQQGRSVWDVSVAVPTPLDLTRQ